MIDPYHSQAASITLTNRSTPTPKAVHEMAEPRHANSPPPSKLPRFSGADPNDGVVTMASPSPKVLGLGWSGSDSSGTDDEDAPTVTTARESRPSTALTSMQRQELEQQTLIYRYFAAGTPVPAHLVLPIWKCVTASSSGTQSFPYRTCGMEPEPGRCRRTDGKKWRCTRGVLPGQKYCERHIHRGRGRSRKKPVAAAASASSADTPANPISAVPAATTGAHAPSPKRLGFSTAGVIRIHGAARAT